MPATSQQRRRGVQPPSDRNKKSPVPAIIPTDQSTAKSHDLADGQRAPWRALFFFTTTSSVPLLGAAVLVSTIGGAVTPARAFLLGKLYDGFTAYAKNSIEKSQLMETETKYVLYLVATSAASWLLQSLEFALWMAFGETQAKSARDRLFHSLLERDTAWYDMRRSGIGALLPRLQTQIQELQIATSQPLGATLFFASCALLSLIQAFAYSWDLTLVTLASAPIIMAILIWVGSGVQRYIDQQTDRLTEAQKYSTGAISAIETVKCFNGQGTESTKYSRTIKEAAKCYIRIANRNALQMALIVMLSTSLFVQGFYYGGVQIRRGRLSSGDVVTTFFSAIGAFQSIQAIFPQLMILEKGRSVGLTLRTIMAKMRTGSAIKSSNGNLKPNICRGDVHIKNVSFMYPSRPEYLALDNVSLHIPGGEFTFLIGKSGSGKSTIGQLLLKFYTPSYGSITMDNTPLVSLDTVWLRSNITLVEQKSLLFNDTVFCNIALGQKHPETVSEAEVMSALEFALLQQTVYDMPNGLDTVVGHKSGSMSGGQQQRMALARARLRDSPVLVLDESTSALDHISRTLIMEAIRYWRHGKTTIMITHDITQILPEDYAFILEDGRVVQEGYRRHMEKLKDSAFQSFLSEVQRGAVSPAGLHKGTVCKSVRTRESSLDQFARITCTESTNEDPVEADLYFGENPRASFIPQALTGSNLFPKVRAYGKGRPITALSSPWSRTIATPPAFSPSSPGTHSGLMRADVKRTDSITKVPLGSNHLSQVLESLTTRTGKAAAEARVHATKTPRRPVQAEDAGGIEMTGTEFNSNKDYQSIKNTLSLKDILSTLWSNLNCLERSSLLLGIWGATIHAVASPLFAYFLSKLLATYAVPGGDGKEGLLYAMVILVVAITDAIHTYLYRLLLEYVGQCWTDSIRCEAFRRILDQPKGFFELRENGISYLAESLDRNAEEMRNLLGRFAAQVYIAALMTIVTILWALAVQWKLTLVALAVGPYIYGVTYAFTAISEKWEKSSNDAAEAASAIFTETFTNIRTVQALTLEAYFLDKYVKATKAALKIGFQRSFYAGLFFGLSDSAGNFSIAMIFYVGAKLVVSDIPVGEVVQVFTMLIFAITKISAILDFIPQIESSQDMASRLLHLTHLPRTGHEHLGDTRIRTVGDIVFDNLRFAYPSRPGQTVLRELSLHFPQGTCTAIVGGSGSGKSTIANLILGLYSANGPGSQTGCLTFSGRDITRIYTPSLRALVVPVSQNPTLFAATVFDNITYGLELLSPYNTVQDVETAAKQAGIHDFITSLPLGYETPIGDGGLGISGGQAQRVAIARALVRRPAVLILDEATSALDVESAALVRQTVQHLVSSTREAHGGERDGREGHSMTVIIITHHREMMAIAERIVVLDQGRVVEEGTFEVLLSKGDGALVNLLNGGQWIGASTGRTADGYARVPLLKSVDWRKKKAGWGKPKAL